MKKLSNITDSVVWGFFGWGGWFTISDHGRHSVLCVLTGNKHNPEIPVAPGEEHWLLDTSLDEAYWPCSHSRAIDLPISRSPLGKNPMPGHLSELHPVNEANTKGQ